MVFGAVGASSASSSIVFLVWADSRLYVPQTKISCEPSWGQNSTESAGQEVLNICSHRKSVTVTRCSYIVPPLRTPVRVDLTMNIDNLTDKTRQSLTAAIQLAKDYSNVQGDWFSSLLGHTSVQRSTLSQSIQHTLQLFSSTKVKLPGLLRQGQFDPFLRQ
jgi:hypothetical protein